jgi:hypothetical protein
LLVDSIRCRSLRGFRLAALPWLLASALLTVVVVIHFAVIHFAVIHLGETVAAVASVAVILAWTLWASRVLPARARDLTAWLADELDTRGENPYPSGPLLVPSLRERFEDTSPSLVRDLKQDWRQWIARPGLNSRLALLVFGIWMLVNELLNVFVRSPDATASKIGTSALGSLVVVGLIDLGRGRIRRLGRCLRTEDGDWPEALDVQWPPSRAPGPIWLVLLLALFVAIQLVFYASSVSDGIKRATALVALLAALWALRKRVGAIAAVEKTGPHKRLVPMVIAMEPVAWWFAAGLQWLFFAIAMLALWVAPTEEGLAAVGLVYLLFGSMILALRADWPRPRDLTLLDADEVHRMLSGTAMEKRIERRVLLLGVAAAVATFAQTL